MRRVLSMDLMACSSAFAHAWHDEGGTDGRAGDPAQNDAQLVIKGDASQSIIAYILSLIESN
jgi:hypothetical protein